MKADTKTKIPGYDYGAVPSSPVSLNDLWSLENAAGFTDEDVHWLRGAGPILAPQAEQIVDSWRARIAAHSEMVKVFFGPDGKPDDAYKAGVKKRFVQWVIDSCERPHDQQWLDYQEEIGKRHTPVKKNLTDRAQSPPVVPLRFLVAFAAVVATTIRPFLESSGRPANEIQNMQDAWTKSMLLHLALWSRPYVHDPHW
jgi:hypothetical protein